ncbi:MAG TPA: hypothetical protein PLM14_12690 [Candidatus Hydrogenedentes bacterium]|nr:hypothetical protein [Candidatus Hydrogenedentota bacterium]HQE83851.1 hypothetical protein [Candidatus Hydrogenedentota bacterium]HQH54413.1 hypothetical protein [Candidatus Hydrogenedentota bacterium]HQM49835.1 hypothetical protein [Candidatus Hydrogenedentota bacterium]
MDSLINFAECFVNSLIGSLFLFVNTILKPFGISFDAPVIDF